MQVWTGPLLSVGSVRQWYRCDPGLKLHPSGSHVQTNSASFVSGRTMTDSVWMMFLQVTRSAETRRRHSYYLRQRDLKYDGLQHPKLLHLASSRPLLHCHVALPSKHLAARNIDGQCHQPLCPWSQWAAWPLVYPLPRLQNWESANFCDFLRQQRSSCNTCFEWQWS